MHRFYLPPERCQEVSLFLTGREAHHAVEVLRVRRDEQVAVLDGAGLEFLCAIRGWDRDRVELAVVVKRAHRPPPCRITLLQALPKGKLIESIIQKATELGAARIVPLLAERVVATLDPTEAARKAEKWRLVAIEAIKQCGLAWLPRVEAPLTPRQFLARGEECELPLIASLQNDRLHPREYFRAFDAEHHRPPRTVCVWIGPEGDFSPAEVEAVKSAGGLPITLGPLVLRTETAAVYCLSVINYEVQAASDAVRS